MENVLDGTNYGITPSRLGSQVSYPDSQAILKVDMPSNQSLEKYKRKSNKFI